MSLNINLPFAVEDSCVKENYDFGAADIRMVINLLINFRIINVMLVLGPVRLVRFMPNILILDYIYSNRYKSLKS